MDLLAAFVPAASPSKTTKASLSVSSISADAGGQGGSQRSTHF